ncbi:hypothetical protein K474DRAFT_1711256 [Panus rudis PR-1116 ss-1]|nr:hypothetical protein K474DRAFT_1711256 [Panus rudis PR-1116 ss-1]
MSKTTSSGNGKILRKAGLLEMYHIARAAYGLDTGVIVSARYTHPSGRLDKETLYPAVRVLVQRNRALSVQVRDSSSKKPLYIGLDSVDLSRIVHFHEETSEHLQAMYESYFLKPFEEDTKDPLWRVAVLSDNHVLFMYHHGIGDGQSGLAFHRQLLTALNALPGGSPTKDVSPIVEIPSSLTFTLPVEKKTDLSVGLPVLWREVRDTFVPVKLRKANRAWTGKYVTKDKSLITRVRLLQLSPAEAEALLRVCRKHKTTFTGYFHTLGVVVLSDLIRTLAPKCKLMSTDIAISLRRYTGTPADAICDEVSGWYMLQPLAKPSRSADDIQAIVDNFPWERSESFTSYIQKNLSKMAQVTGTLKFLFGNFKGYYEGKLNTKRGSTYSLSNLGRFPSDKVSPDSSGGWHIDSMFFSQCDAVVGAAMKLSVSTAENGAVGLGFSWGPNALDDDFAERFVERFNAIMKAMIEKEK